MIKRAVRSERCKNCNFCISSVCPSPNECIGCNACYIACPNEAVELVDVEINDYGYNLC